MWYVKARDGEKSSIPINEECTKANISITWYEWRIKKQYEVPALLMVEYWANLSADKYDKPQIKYKKIN